LEPNIAALLCWIPLGPIPIVACIVFLVADPYKQNKFIKFHALQSLFFLGAAIALWVVMVILGFVLAMLGPLALIMLPLWLVFMLGILGVAIFMCIKAYGNQTFKLPFIGELAAKNAGL
jgi:uncharacterized membrane protein